MELLAGVTVAVWVFNLAVVLNRPGPAMALGLGAVVLLAIIHLVPRGRRGSNEPTG